MRATPIVKLKEEEIPYYEARKKKPYRMTDNEIRNSLCEVGMSGYCHECRMCEYGKEFLKRGLNLKKKGNAK